MQTKGMTAEIMDSPAHERQRTPVPKSWINRASRCRKLNDQNCQFGKTTVLERLNPLSSECDKN